MQNLVGHLIDNFKIVSILGEGGMGKVYKAFDIKLERYVAIKVLNAQSLSQPQFVERFKREAKNQAKLNHPNIVPVFGFTEEGDVLGIVMEYVEGETLEKIISRKGKLELTESLNIIKQILAGVGFAHSKGFIHRDLKPSNIIINKEGVAKIMDFGISKAIYEKGITKTGTKIGTLLYMSPEQIRAEEPTRQSDIYSIGITLYEMLSGRTPFDFGTEYDIMEGHLKKNARRLSINLDNIPPEFDKIMHKTLEKNIYKRYKYCQELLDEIDIVLGKYEGRETKKEIKTQTTSEFGRKIKITLSALFVVAVLVTLTYFVFNLVSDYWANMDSNTTGADSTSFTYKSNPSFIAKSDWLQLNTYTDKNINSIDFLSASTGYACGEGGTLIKTTDAGNTWIKVDFPDSADLNAIRFPSLDLGIIITDSGKIFVSRDAGLSWLPNQHEFGEKLSGIFFIDRFTGFITGSKGLVLKSTDRGENWTLLNTGTTEYLFKVFFIDPDVGFAIGWSGTVLKTNDQGNSWNKISVPTKNYLRDIWMVDDKTGIIIGAGGEVFRTSDGGESWIKTETGVISGLTAISFIDKKIGFITTSRGEILETSDAGKTWSETKSGLFVALTGISIPSSKSIYISGNNGVVLKRK
ncbi:MAG TPA: protein kinase [Ignavibacteriaceae bacterium]|nr:protein kinase [Ignavibacteriaceae bacterium]